MPVRVKIITVNNFLRINLSPSSVFDVRGEIKPDIFSIKDNQFTSQVNPSLYFFTSIYDLRRIEREDRAAVMKSKTRSKAMKSSKKMRQDYHGLQLSSTILMSPSKYSHWNQDTAF